MGLIMAACNYCTYDEQLIKTRISPRNYTPLLKDGFKDSKPGSFEVYHLARLIEK
jgi:hypothetical protein